MALCVRNSAEDEEEAANDESDEGSDDEFHYSSALELSMEDWNFWPVDFSAPDLALAKDIIRSLVCNGGNIYAENSTKSDSLSLARDTALKTDMVSLTRRSLLLFFEAVCISDDLTMHKSFLRVAENTDLGRCIARFL